MKPFFTREDFYGTSDSVVAMQVMADMANQKVAPLLEENERLQKHLEQADNDERDAAGSLVRAEARIATLDQENAVLREALSEATRCLNIILTPDTEWLPPAIKQLQVHANTWYTAKTCLKNIEAILNGVANAVSGGAEPQARAALDTEAQQSIRRGLEQSAKGEVKSLGSFAQYAKDGEKGEE